MKRFAILARERFTADGMAVNIKDFTLRHEGDDDPAQLLNHPDLSLYCLDLEHKEAVFVSTPSGIDLKKAPFYYQAQFEHAETVFTVSFDTFLDLSARISTPDTLVLIHNIGRCGSTLLSKAFSQLGSCISYSEPDCFTQTAFWRSRNDPRDELWKSLLPACMNFTFRDTGSQRPSTAIIKFRSGCLNLLDLFLDGFPNAKHLFLYRDCSSWVASLVGLMERDRPLPDLSREKALNNCRFNNGRALDQSRFPFNQLGENVSVIERLTVSWLVYIELVTKIHPSYAPALLPVREIGAIEKNDRVRRRRAGHARRNHDFRMRARRIVHVPGHARQDGRIGETEVRIGRRILRRARGRKRGGGGKLQKIVARHGVHQDNAIAARETTGRGADTPDQRKAPPPIDRGRGGAGGSGFELVVDRSLTGATRKAIGAATVRERLEQSFRNRAVSSWPGRKARRSRHSLPSPCCGPWRRRSSWWISWWPSWCSSV